MLNKKLRKYIQKIQQAWFLDLRSLSLFRIGLSLVVITDLLLRSRYIVEHYTDMGIYPRIAYQTFGEAITTFSLHAANGQLWYQILLFLIHGFFGLWILFGYRTKIATFIVWGLTVSLQNRNMLIHSGADDLLRMVLFWSMFLPLDRYWSWDRERYIELSEKNIFSLGVIAFVLQQLSLYWATAYLKLGPAWYGEHDAVYKILSLEAFHLPISDITYHFPFLMKIITIGSMGVEILGPLLLISPFWSSQARIIGVFLLLLLHGGILTHLSVGIFPWIAGVSLLAFLPGKFWNWMEYFSPKGKVSLYFDDKCGLCGRWIRILKNFGTLSGVNYIGLSRAPENIQKMSAEYDMWVIEREGKYFLGYDGFVEVIRQSWIFRLFGIIGKWGIPLSIGRTIYQIISKRRKYCTFPKPIVPYQDSYTKHIIASIILTLSLYCSIMVNISVMACGNSWKNFFYGGIGNIFSLIGEKNFHILESEKNAGWIGSHFTLPRKSPLCSEKTGAWYSGFFWWWMMVPRLDQYWGMFAPEPANTDYWPVIEADLVSKNDGTIVGRDIWREYVFGDGVISFAKYENPHDITISDRWRKYIYGLVSYKNNSNYTKYFGEYWCKKYNSDISNPYLLDRFVVYSISEKIYPDYKRGPTQREPIWKQCCLKEGCFNEKTSQ